VRLAKALPNNPACGLSLTQGLFGLLLLSWSLISSFLVLVALLLLLLLLVLVLWGCRLLFLSQSAFLPYFVTEPHSSAFPATS
jgi:hypothetical protein